MKGFSSKERKIKIAKSTAASLAAGISIFYITPQAYANTAPANITLPTGEQKMPGVDVIRDPNNPVMNIDQHGLHDAYIKWGDFSIGANATVNFKGDISDYNMLNYVTGSSASQIYGRMNANNNGNIYVVNPNGVQIGKSAQINVGSLYVSNKDLDKVDFNNFETVQGIINDPSAQRTNAELMSLGNINATNVTFVGNRVVLDTDRVTGKAEVSSDNKDVVLGYTKGSDQNNTTITSVDNLDEYKYQWVKNLQDLQNMKDNTRINYALNNSIDAIPTKDTNFESIQDFRGKFDGLNNNIFGLTINRKDESNVGLFGSASGATIKNVNLVNGSITGGTNVGAIVGNAKDTTIENIVNSAKVTGKENIGGIAGSTADTTLTDVINTGTVEGYANAGGLAGSMTGTDKSKSQVNGNSYNLGAIHGLKEDLSAETTDFTGKTEDEVKTLLAGNKSYNIGGLVGSAKNTTLGDGTTQIFNGMTVQGGYNVGGIVGSMESSTVQNAANNADITATGYRSEDYKYHGNNDGGLPGAGYGSNFYTDQEKTINGINAANAGGIAGNASSSTIEHVINTGDIETVQFTKGSGNSAYEVYAGGNVGGIAGRLSDTNVDDAENKENKIFASHNVGGVAGYVEGKSAISNAVNNGGEVLGTGALKGTDFAEEVVVDNRDKNNHIGNIGGIAGYMYGDSAYIRDSANRGYIHSMEDMTKESSKAGNIGGVVGKIDRSKTLSQDELKTDYARAAVSNSYNTGDIKGYINVGGVAGMMYNGEVAGSYNSGSINTTRNSKTYTGTLNMGGIVGETTEGTNARVLLYDVYNRGDIGDKTFAAGSRHVGGIVGRLSGDVESSYNKGNIYNNAVATGGIVGWMTKGSVNNSFNAGNITVKNTGESDYSGVGGIVGGTGYATNNMPEDDKILTIKNVYNLGVLRNFGDNSSKDSLGGIVGVVNHNTKKLNISNVYTTGEMYLQHEDNNSTIGSIYGSTQNGGQAPNIENAYYIKAKDGSGFTAVNDNQATGTIEYDASRHNVASYSGLFENDEDKGGIKGDWRIYDGTTPILNAFLPKLAEGNNITSKTENVDVNKVQFGNAYNPFATIIDAAGKEIKIDDSGAGAIGNVDSVIVRNGSLTVNNAANTGNTMYSGTLYADGSMTLNGSNISLGSISNLYGSTVTVNSAGDLKAYGNIISTGANGKENSININTTNGGDIEILGTVKSAAKGEPIVIDGMDNGADDKTVTEDTVKDHTAIMPEVGEQYSFKVNSQANGDINISAKDDKGNAGKVDILYGNLGKGYINSSGDVAVTGSEVYMDSDLNIGGDLTINADTSVLDISNVGKTKAAEKGGTQKEYLHGEGNFLSHFTNGNSITFNTTAGKAGNIDAMIAVDMWDYEKGQFDLTKFDATDGHLFSSDLDNLHLNGTNKDGQKLTGRNTTYIWVGSGEQLAGIQQYKDSKPDSGILSFSFALKNDIDASQIGSDYKSIGSGDTAFTGVFDGRGNRIIGLNTVNNANDSNALFGTIGDDKGNGTVKDIKVYSFTVEDDGVIANTNNGTVDGISAFGNAVSGTGTVGGIVGTNTNSGTIKNTTSASVVVNTGSADTVVGGIAGTNAGTITNTESNSAVTSDTSLSEKSALGGIAGSNSGTIEDVVSKGVTTGLYNNNADGNYTSFKTAGNVGGIAGINTNEVKSAYNESIVSGMKNVGGVVGSNSNSGTIENLANATNVYGGDNVGGIAGSNDGTLNNGRNNGEIFGGKNITDENAKDNPSKGTNVGGLVGVSGESSSMSNLTNDMSASITGHTNVGGLIGLNKGSFTDGQNLMNRGVISGVSNVGGSIGENAGIVANVNNVNTADIVKNDAYENGANADESDKKYENFGGVIGHNARAGQNDPTGGTYSKDGIVYNVSNNMDVSVQNADDVKYIGGIIGSNDGIVLGKLLNGGDVTGNENVGGVIGRNNAVIDSNSDAAKAAIETVKNALGVDSIDDGKAEVSLINGAVADYNKETGKTDYSTIKIEKDANNKPITNTVSGKINVGGVIGSNNSDNNSADISHTNVVNTVAGIVTGNTNVGGLFGTNSGIVAGGRDDNGNYYKYHIVNNGSVKGTDTNAGGLVGINIGTLTTGYNTGSVIGNNSVGGIAGKNDGGTIELVFSNVENGNKINGKNDAGGVVGYNHGGTLRNAYSIGAVDQYDNVLNVIGNDFSDETTTFSYRSEKEAAEKAKVSGSDWKLQNGLAAPMLKVFLTKLVYHEKGGATADFPYDGNLHGFTMVVNEDKKIAEVYKDGEMIGYLAAADSSGIHSLKDYFDTVGSGADLISSNSQSEVGEYEMFFSHQINTSKADTPNKLGYEFVQGSSYDPGDPDDPKNPGGNKFDPDDPTNPGTDTPEYEIIDNPGWENGRWEYLFDDNPWGRKRNFRERKAEFNYQQGGTEIDEADEGEADAEPEAEA